MQIDKEIVEDLLYQWKKPEVNKQSRARFIRGLIKELKLSHREFCKEYKIPKSTLTGWLCFSKLTEDQYRELRNEGCSEKVIYDSLKCKDSNVINTIKAKSSYEAEFSAYIQITTKRLKEYVLNPPLNDNGMMLYLSNLKNTVNQLIRKMEK